MSLLRVLAVALCVAVGLRAQEGHDPQDREGSAGIVATGEHHPGPQSTLEMENNDFFVHQYQHTVPHPIGELGGITFFDVNLFQIIAVVLMAVIFGAVLTSFGTGRPSWLVRIFRGFCLWIRDEMLRPVMGEEEARKFTPYFLYLFFFIAFCNLLGLVPVVGRTPTASIWITAFLALTTFAIMLIGGMMQQGVVVYWKNLIPHGLPAWLVPLMVVLELIGLLVKPFALCIRLFANMLAGHLVIASFIGMVFLFAKLLELSWASWATALPAVGMGIFIMIIEGFVALLQAYIFTYLSIVFVQQALHPAH